MAKGLNIIGLLNIQFVLSQGEVYVLEVNPRSSRTVPFLSKITKIPMANLATKVILGQKLADFGYQEGCSLNSRGIRESACLLIREAEKSGYYVRP